MPTSILFNGSASTGLTLSSGLPATTDGTFSYFINFTAQPSAYTCPFITLASTSGGQGHNILVGANGTDLIYQWNQSGGYVGLQIQPSQWYFFALVAQNSVASVYWKAVGAGGLFREDWACGSATPTEYSIGAFNGALPLNGSICGLKLWTGFLSAAELARESEQLAPVRQANLWEYFPLSSATDLRGATSRASTLTAAGATNIAQTVGPPIRYSTRRRASLFSFPTFPIFGTSVGSAVGAGSITGLGILSGTSVGSSFASASFATILVGAMHGMAVCTSTAFAVGSYAGLANPYAGTQVAGDVSPTPLALSGNALLFDADRTLYFCLDFFSWVIANYPGPRMLQAFTSAGVKGPGGTVLTSACGARYPHEPGPFLLENQMHFPSLSMWRKAVEPAQKTAGWEEDKSTFGIAYVLPPLSLGQAEQVHPILTQVYRAIRTKITQSYDPGYTPPGGALGQSPFELAFAAIDRVALERAQYGYLEGTGNLLFPCVTMDLSVLERDMYYEPGASKFAGADVTADLYAADGTIIDPFVQVSTQGAPTITTLSVTSGPVAGGTSVTVSGALFLPGKMQVLFGGIPAASVMYSSPMAITVVTPSMAGAGTVPLTIINRDGQMAIKRAAFTFI